VFAMKELCVCDRLINLFQQTTLHIYGVQYGVQLAGDVEGGKEEMLEVFEKFETEFQILKDAYLEKDSKMKRFEATLNTCEIADICEMSYSQVDKDIRAMFDLLKMDSKQFSSMGTLDGQPFEFFDLPKRETLLVAFNYEFESFVKILDKWKELDESIKDHDL
jgi:hypothetical protein